MSDRPGMVVGKTEHPVVGPMLSVGTAAPNFKLNATNWTMKSLGDYAGKVKIVSVVPSLDTGVCSAQTRRFNEEIVNRILEDLVAACAPRHLWVHGEFASRGGIGVSVEAFHPATALRPPSPRPAGRRG